MLKQTIKSALLTSLIVALIFGIITFSYVDNYLMAYTYVGAEINPSVAFELNKQNIVIKALPMNESAQVLDLASMKGKTFINAIELFVSQSDKHELIKDNANMYMTAVQLKNDMASFDALKTSVFGSKELKRLSKRINIGFATSSVEKLKLSQSARVSLRSFSESTVYLNIASLNSAKASAGKEYLLFKSENEMPDLNSDELKLSIDSFLREIEKKHREYEPIQPNFVLAINARMNVPNANYYKIYHDVIIYWDELNDTINQDKISAHTHYNSMHFGSVDVSELNETLTSESKTFNSNLEVQQTVENCTCTEKIGSSMSQNHQDIAICVYDEAVALNCARDINSYEITDSDDLSTAQPVEEFFFVRKALINASQNDMSTPQTHFSLKNRRQREVSDS